MLSPKLDAYFREYAEYHQHPMNRLTHKIAIPLIVFHILAMLDWIKLPVEIPGIAGYSLSLGHLLLVPTVAWYLTLDVKLAALTAFLYLLAFPLAAITPWWAVVGNAIVAWLIQLAGHSVWEKKSPALTKNLLQLLIGPLFFVAILTGAWQLPGMRTPAGV
jgi:uncharacterized membrane protein YGL010W